MLGEVNILTLHYITYMGNLEQVLKGLEDGNI